jgi:UMF1 family MFS transporter
LISPTPSVEADDEESFSMDNSSSQETEPIGDGEQAEAQYEGEDVRLTSAKELSGWYSYGFAAEVFAICAMGKSPRQVRNPSNAALFETTLHI